MSKENPLFKDLQFQQKQLSWIQSWFKMVGLVAKPIPSHSDWAKLNLPLYLYVQETDSNLFYMMKS